MSSACAGESGAPAPPSASGTSDEVLSYQVLAAEERDPFTELVCQLFGCPDEEESPPDSMPDAGAEPPPEVLPDVCGDGILGPNEDCDLSAGVGDPYTCKINDCRFKKIYNACISAADCDYDGACLYGYCTYPCEIDKDCPLPLGDQDVGVACNNYCVVVDCHSDADCPQGNLCEPAQTTGANRKPSFCRGCMNDGECTNGRLCVKRPGAIAEAAGICL